MALAAPIPPARLRGELAALYLAAPVVAALIPLDSVPLLALAALGGGLALLHATPGFRWRELTTGWSRVAWGRVMAFAGATAVVGLVVVLTLRPEAAFEPGRSRPWLLAAIVLLYPPLSALPQELLFRALFFRRYGPVLPRGVACQVALNAALFALAHLAYRSWVVALMTLAGGLAFAHAHRVRGSFPEAVALHAAAGAVLFALGLGTWFFLGGARP